MGSASPGKRRKTTATKWITASITATQLHLVDRRDATCTCAARPRRHPMVVLRRLDCLLEPTEQGRTKFVFRKRTQAHRVRQVGLRRARGQCSSIPALYPQSWSGRASSKYLSITDSFSANVRDRAEVRHQAADRDQAERQRALGVLEGHLPEINLAACAQSGETLPGLTNLGMAMYSELIRRFNEENNEEAGEHFTHARSSS